MKDNSATAGSRGGCERGWENWRRLSAQSRWETVAASLRVPVAVAAAHRVGVTVAVARRVRVRVVAAPRLLVTEREVEGCRRAFTRSPYRVADGLEDEWAGKRTRSGTLNIVLGDLSLP